MKKYGFTLAEVLITLGIIGVVAALTLPTLIQNYRKHVVITSLKKSYSVFSQALRMAEVEFGSFENIAPPEVDHDADSMEQWWNTYLAKYFVGTKTYKQNQWFIVAYNSGGGIGIKSTSTNTLSMFIVDCINLKKCLASEFQSMASMGANSDGKNSFVFHLGGGKYQPDGVGLSRDILLNDTNYGCANEVNGLKRRYCAALIMHDNWEIADDYPVSF